MALIEQNLKPWFTREYISSAIKDHLLTALDRDPAAIFNIELLLKPDPDKPYVLEEFLRKENVKLEANEAKIDNKHTQEQQKMGDEAWQERKARQAYMKQALRIAVYSAAIYYVKHTIEPNKAMSALLVAKAASAPELIAAFRLKALNLRKRCARSTLANSGCHVQPR